MKKGGVAKRGISWVEIMVAFTIFLIGVSVIFYFFTPFFKPEYRTVLDELIKNFESNLLIEVNWSKFVINDTSNCVEFQANLVKENILIYNPTFNLLNFSIQSSNLILNASKEKEFYLLEANQVNQGPFPTCSNPKKVKAFFAPKIKDRFINLSYWTQPISYQQLKQILIPNLNFDFNLTLIIDGNWYSIGKPLAKAQVIGKEKIYRVIKNKKIKKAKVRFYLW